MKLKGQFLVAMPTMEDEVFGQSLIYMLEYDESNALGLIVNKLTDVPLEELFARFELPTIFSSKMVHFGGPVAPSQGIILHDTGKYGSTVLVGREMRYSFTLDVLQKIIENKGPKNFLIGLGHVGWDGGQLMDEIARDNWLVAPFNKEILFDLPVQLRYDAALASLGVNPALFKSLNGVGNA